MSMSRLQDPIFRLKTMWLCRGTYEDDFAGDDVLSSLLLPGFLVTSSRIDMRTGGKGKEERMGGVRLGPERTQLSIWIDSGIHSSFSLKPDGVKISRRYLPARDHHHAFPERKRPLDFCGNNHMQLPLQFSLTSVVVGRSSFSAEQGTKWQAYAAMTMALAILRTGGRVPCPDDDACESNGNDDKYPEVLGHDALAFFGIPREEIG
nr:serine proteinase related protein [imported] - Neurospora crassa [Neurospora crassa]